MFTLILGLCTLLLYLSSHYLLSTCHIYQAKKYVWKKQTKHNVCECRRLLWWNGWEKWKRYKSWLKTQNKNNNTNEDMTLHAKIWMEKMYQNTFGTLFVIITPFVLSFRTRQVKVMNKYLCVLIDGDKKNTKWCTQYVITFYVSLFPSREWLLRYYWWRYCISDLSLSHLVELTSPDIIIDIIISSLTSLLSSIIYSNLINKWKEQNYIYIDVVGCNCLKPWQYIHYKLAFCIYHVGMCCIDVKDMLLRYIAYIYTKI